MSLRGDIARLVKALKYIHTIEKIIARHDSALDALRDLEGQPALLMCLIQIGELLNQLHDEALMTRLETRKIVAFRNIVVHEYESVLIEKINTILLQNLPQLKTQLIKEIEKEPDSADLLKLCE